MKRIFIYILAAVMLFGVTGCELSGQAAEDLAYIKENADKIGDMLGQFADAIAKDPEAFFEGDGTEETSKFLEPLLNKTWTLGAIEDADGYTDQIYEDEEKRFLLAEEWIRLHFPTYVGVGTQSGEVVIEYMNGNDYEKHSYQFQKSDEGLVLFYLFPDYDTYGQDPDYNTWTEMRSGEEGWPFLLPLQGESWFLKYDAETDRILIERTRSGEEAPYFIWYLNGESWYS